MTIGMGDASFGFGLFGAGSYAVVALLEFRGSSVISVGEGSPAGGVGEGSPAGGVGAGRPKAIRFAETRP
jgi:hypothetical protein